MVLMLLAVPVVAQNRLETVSPALDSVAAQPFRAHLDSIRRHRPTVALVLSGGGAKGAAHVGALRYLESIGLPVDVVIGTSIGGLVGGLYSVGYGADQMDTLFRSLDWQQMLGDKMPARYKDYRQRLYDSKVQLTLSLKRTSDLPTGLVAGNNVGALIETLTAPWSGDSLSFSSLPVPFVCVATDLVSGKAKVWYGGSILAAMRSTMSIPGLFAAVKTDGMVLIDGGMRDNYPIDIARDLGADIVIGVDLSQGYKNFDQINGLQDIMEPMTSLFARGIYEHNVTLADVSIHPRLKGYDMLSFKPEAIDFMIEKGYETAASMADTLQAVLRKTGRAGAAPALPYALAKGLDRLNILPEGEDEPNRAAVGLRFDDEELAAVLLSYGLNTGRRKGHSLDMMAKIGLNPYVSTVYKYKTGSGFFLGADAFYRYTDRDRFVLGKDLDTHPHYHQLKGRIGAGGLFWKNFSFMGGLQGEFFALRNEHGKSYLGAFASIVLDNTDDVFFPSRGLLLKADYAVHTFTGKASAVIPLGKAVSLIPSFYASVIAGGGHGLPYMTAVGGLYEGRYVDAQLPFAGIRGAFITDDDLYIGRVDLRVRIASGHYITGTYNRTKDIDGLSMEYAWNSAFAGPLRAGVQWNSLMDKVSFYISLGKNF